MKVIVPTKFNYEEGSYSRNTIATYYNIEGILSTAAINELRINYDPVTLKCVGTLIELSATNNCLYSEDYSNIIWQRNGTTIGSSILGPDNTYSGTKLVESGTADHSISQVLTGSFSGLYGFSNFVKLAERSKIKLEVLGIGGYTYDLATNTYSTIGSAIMPVIKTLRNNWKRIGFTIDLLTTNPVYRISILDSSGNSSYNAISGNGIYIFGSQIEPNNITSYIKTLGSSSTRAEDQCSGSVAGIYYSNLQETEYLQWNNSTSYIPGNTIIRNHKIYTCTEANSAVDPEISVDSISPVWSYVKPTNRWAMFDLYTNRSTSSSY